jgi:ATP-binding cassette subfamily B (MDR/TAP) protein 1
MANDKTHRDLDLGMPVKEDRSDGGRRDASVTTNQTAKNPVSSSVSQVETTYPSSPKHTVVGIPKAPNVHDELHPTNSTNPSLLTAAEEKRLMDDRVTNEKEGLTNDTTVATGGAFFPSATGAMGFVPAVPVSSSSTIAAGQNITEKPSRSDSHSSVSSTSLPKSKTEGQKQPIQSKKSYLPFSKSRKTADSEEKKAKQKEEEANAVPSVGMFALFRFATPLEKFLDIIGLILAAAAGATQPLMTLIFGRLTNSFTAFAVIVNGLAQNGITSEGIAELAEAKRQLKRESGQNALFLMAIGIGMAICTWLVVYCPIV